LGVVAVNGKIYAIGGSIADYIFSDEDVVGTNERYDPETDTWTTLTPMTTPRVHFAIAAYKDKIYCIGGQTKWNSTCCTTEVYDIAADSWSTKTSIPFDIQLITLNVNQDLHANVVNGKIFITTFSGDQNMFEDTQHLLNGSKIEKICLRLFMYDPATDIWTEKASAITNLAVTDCRLVSAVADDKIIVICSFYHFILVTDRGFNGVVETNVLSYDPKTDIWREVSSAPMEAFYYATTGTTTGLYAPQNIYMLQDTRNDVYDPIKDTWVVGKNIPTGRQKCGIAVIDDILYVIGGITPTRFEIIPDISPLPIPVQDCSSANEQYIPLGYGTTSEPLRPNYINYLIVATLAITIVTVTGGVVFYFKKRNRKSDTM
ncbi:MAG: hypothetical protein LBE70_00465, partial [Nitrososphaerota archaeon]|nr:hypothetical protein [Nitrososphaerota archaeon]